MSTTGDEGSMETSDGDFKKPKKRNKRRQQASEGSEAVVIQ